MLNGAKFYKWQWQPLHEVDLNRLSINRKMRRKQSKTKETSNSMFVCLFGWLFLLFFFFFVNELKLHLRSSMQSPHRPYTSNGMKILIGKKNKRWG